MLTINATDDAGNALRSMYAWHERDLHRMLSRCWHVRRPWINWDSGTLSEFFPPLEYPQ